MKAEECKRLLELYKTLIKYNLIIYKSIQTINNKRVRRDRELGVGEYYAWQIPAYREVLMRLMEKD